MALVTAYEHGEKPEVLARRVTDVFETVARLLYVWVGGRLIKTTYEHPFFVDGRARPGPLTLP